MIMSSRPVKIFNVFDLQFGGRKDDHLYIQEVIDYCEDWFCAILAVFGHADHQ